MHDNYIEGMEFAYNEISKELHDDVCNRLLILEMGLTYESISMKETIAQISEIRKKIRQLSHHLLTPDFDTVHLSILISSFLDQVAIQDVIKISKYLEPSIDNMQAKNNTKLQIFRIIQEIITNIIKHGKASQIYFTMRRKSRYLSIVIEDNGCDFESAQTIKGVGLQIIQKRIISLKGRIINNPYSTKGNIIDIQIPINENIS